MKTMINYARFYALLKKMRTSNRDELKEQLVWQFSSSRTYSIRELSYPEYNNMCAHMASVIEQQEQNTPRSVAALGQQKLKAARSAVLKRMQKLGIDTTEWANIDNFCLNPRICGKVFYHLSIEELADLIPKLEAIAKKDRIKARINSFPSYQMN